MNKDTVMDVLNGVRAALTMCLDTPGKINPDALAGSVSMIEVVMNEISGGVGHE